MRFQTMTLAFENSGKTILLLRAKERPLSEPHHIQGLKVTCWRDSCKPRAVSLVQSVLCPKQTLYR